MINKILKIRNIGCFENFCFDNKELKEFNKINIIYGSNGSGKTTLTNILYLLSKHCKDKQQLFDEVIEENSELEIINDNKEKITEKNLINKDKDLYVFNSKFITDHVYNGNTANIDSFSQDIKLTSPEIERIDEDLDKNNTRYNKFNNWIKAIEKQRDEIFKKYNDEFQENVIGSRLTRVKPAIDKKITGNIDHLKEELRLLYTEYSNKSQESNTREKIQNLKEIIDSLKNIDFDLEKIQEKIRTKISTDAKGKISQRIESYEQKIDEKNLRNLLEDLNDWYKKGGRLLHLSKEIDNHCPLCNTDLTEYIDSIIHTFSSYFHDALEELYDTIDQNKIILDLFINEGLIEKNNETIDHIIMKCDKEFNIQIEPFQFDKTQNDLLLSALKELSALLEQKKRSPEASLALEKKYKEVIEEYINKVDEFRDEAIKKINKEIEKIQGKSLKSIIDEIKSKISELCSLELNAIENNIFPSTNKTNSDIAKKAKNRLEEVSNIIENLKKERVVEISKLDAESKYINLYLKYFGINNFTINRLKDKSQDNLVINYTNTGEQKTKLEHSLSEGEKTALAFAYFVSKLRVEKIEGTNDGFNNSTIVIDDPVSSFDDNRLFQTANLIDSFLFFNLAINEKELDNEMDYFPEQVFILSHNLKFIKFLHNALKSNDSISDYINEYYLAAQSPHIKKLPSGLKNFTNTYILKLKEIIAFKEGKIGYENVKNYLPNYIRIVLETFLSFKLATVNDSNDRLPGLSYLIKRMISEIDQLGDLKINDISKNGVIRRLNHLKKIADHESHGNMYKAEEFTFISEEELKIYAKNTIQVINYIDSIHFHKVKAHN
ncbi:MAG: AAA family ATPase [Candidatus Woesearchaeota archaeon]